MGPPVLHLHAAFPILTRCLFALCPGLDMGHAAPLTPQPSTALPSPSITPLSPPAGLLSDLSAPSASSDFAQAAKIRGLLLSVAAELPDAPLYYDLHDVCRTVRCTAPKSDVFKSALVNAGYRCAEVVVGAGGQVAGVDWRSTKARRAVAHRHACGPSSLDLYIRGGEVLGKGSDNGRRHGRREGLPRERPFDGQCTPSSLAPSLSYPVAQAVLPSSIRAKRSVPAPHAPYPQGVRQPRQPAGGEDRRAARRGVGRGALLGAQDGRLGGGAQGPGLVLGQDPGKGGADEEGGAGKADRGTGEGVWMGREGAQAV